MASFAWLEPVSDGLRNYQKAGQKTPAEVALIDKAQLSTLTAPELTVLIGGLRAINVNVDGSTHGIFTDKPGVLTNNFFLDLLDMSTKWKAVSDSRAEVLRPGRPPAK